MRRQGIGESIENAEYHFFVTEDDAVQNVVTAVLGTGPTPLLTPYIHSYFWGDSIIIGPPSISAHSVGSFL